MKSKQNLSRAAALLLTAVMAVQMLPMSAFAEGEPVEEATPVAVVSPDVEEVPGEEKPSEGEVPPAEEEKADGELPPVEEEKPDGEEPPVAEEPLEEEAPAEEEDLFLDTLEGDSWTPADMTLGYAKIRDTEGKLWIGNIGDTVFDEITYSAVSGERQDQVELDPGTGKLTAKEGYTIAATGRPNQEVTFKVDANYYDPTDVLFVENFEEAELGDKGTANGGGQKFSGVYGDKPGMAAAGFVKGEPFAMPIVADPAKARTGEKSVTQGVKYAQSEGVTAPFGHQLSESAVATMWYYDDGVTNMSAQTAFMGGITSGWTTGAFNGAMGMSWQSATNPPNANTEYSDRTRSSSGNWNSTGVARAEGWHKFQWEIGESETKMSIDGTPLKTTSPVNQSNFGGFHITFNWNNMSEPPFNNKHFIDSFSVVKDSAVASETFTETATVYVVSEDDVLSFGFTKESDTKGTLALDNVAGIGATMVSTVFSTADNIADKLTLNTATGAVETKEGYLLSDATNPLATKVTFAVKATYHFGTPSETETFEATVDVYYDVDESKLTPDPLTGTGEREVVDLNGSWQFGGKNIVTAEPAAPAYDDAAWQTVTVPHDWNARTGYDGRSRENGTFWYRKTLTLTPEEAAEYNQRSAYLEFDSVGMDTVVYLNGEQVGTHRGGWSAFKIDVTGKLQEGDNVIAVSANNERKLNGDISPLHGDFDNASGINRDVRLVMTSQVHLDQLDHGSGGVYMIPQRTQAWNGTSDKTWEVDVTARIANDTISSRDVTVVATVSHPRTFDDVLKLDEKGLLLFDPADMCDPNGTVVGTQAVSQKAMRSSATEIKLTVPVTDPKLWNGTVFPYQYVAKIEVYEGEGTEGALLDSYETMIGFRYFDAVRTDKNGYGTTEGDGFFLNGEPYLLRGMAIHEDWPGLGRALERKYIEKDVELLYEMGATWTRVSHYPHNRYRYELLSQYGIACSAEIPLVDGVSLVDINGNPSTNKTSGTLSPAFKQVTLDQMRDMVKQNYNQAAILGWLMQNELGGGSYGQGTGADANAAQLEMITALNDLVHELDPGRKSVMAVSVSNCYNFPADWLLWNGYPGWYGDAKTGIGYFVDGNANSTDPKRMRPTGISEYGAGVNPFHQTDYIRDVTDFSKWNGSGAAFHPESYGNDRNEQSLREILARPFYWATGGWIMFDFSASGRGEGGRQGINDKGLVYKARPEEVEGYDVDTGDPEDLLLRKDGFYLYKANLNKNDPLTYIAERRYEMRAKQDIKVTVYSNAPVVELWQNGVKVGTMEATELQPYVDRNSIAAETAACIFKFDVTLAEGGNTFVAKGLNLNGTPYSEEDTVTWQYGDPEELDIRSDVFTVMNGTKTIMLTGSGIAGDIASLVAPANPAVRQTYRVLTADREPVTSGPIKAGMLLEVCWGENAMRLYTFQNPYLSALKSITVDGSASTDAGKALDFKEETLWEAEDTEAHSLVIDLGKKYVLTEIKINWANAGDASQYKVYTSDDGAIWNTAADRSANAVADGVAQNELQSYGRYVKIDLEAGSSPAISEIEVYGWMVSLLPGEDRIFVSETERTICVPTDIPDFHSDPNSMSSGMSFTAVEPLLVFEGNGSAAHENYDYSLDFSTSRYVVTDTLGREIPFRFLAFTDGTKPAGPFELAMGKPTTSTGIEKTGMEAINATTENDNRWNGARNTSTDTNQWITVDLGAECTLSSIELHFPTKGNTGINSDRYYRYEVLGGSSADGTFETIISGSSQNLENNIVPPITQGVSGKTARFIRVRVENSNSYQPGLNRLYVKGTAAAPTTHTAALTVNLNGEAYTGHGKTFTLRQNGLTYAIGSGSDGTVSFTGLLDGLYDVYEDARATGVTLAINGDDGAATLNYYTAGLSVKLDGEAYTGYEKTATLRQNGLVAATGTGADGVLTFGALFEGVYDIYADDEDTGADLTIAGAAGEGTLHYYTVTFQSADETVDTVIAAEGQKLVKPADPTNGSGTFSGWYQEEALNTAWNFDADVVAGTITLYAKWVSTPTGGGSSGGGNTTTTTEKNDDGSTTKTVTNKTTGTVTETTTYPNGDKTVVETKKDGTVTETVTQKDGYKSETVTKADGTVTQKVTTAEGVKSETKQDAQGNTTADVTIPKKAVEDGKTVTLPIPAVDAGKENTVTVTAPKGAEVQVEVPVKDATAGTVAVIVNEDGTETIVKTSVPTENGLTLTVEGAVSVKIVDNSKDFADVAEEHWAAEAVAFVTSRELFNGTGEDTFAPADTTSRAMLFTVLARLEGVETDGGEMWYAKAMDWAKSTGISDGTMPEASITREQLATMLYRSAGEPAAEGEGKTFTDSDQVSDWAAEAMDWCVKAGVLTGKDGDRLDPSGTATRAEVATMLQRFITARVG